MGKRGKLFMALTVLGWFLVLASVARAETSASAAADIKVWNNYLRLPREQRTQRNREMIAEFKAGWTQVQRENLLKNFLKNSDGTYSGAVVASPSTGKPSQPDEPGEPNYFYHWVRDASLAVAQVADLYEAASDPTEKGEYLSDCTSLKSVRRGTDGR